nr:vesicle-associated membrane protein 7 [Aotus nancymaae]
MYSAFNFPAVTFAMLHFLYLLFYSYLFHYICQDRIVYLCITDDDFERSRAFNFLNEIKKRFQTTYGSRAQTALPYAMNSEFSSVLAAQLVRSFSGCSYGSKSQNYCKYGEEDAFALEAHTAYDGAGRVLLLAAIEYQRPVSTCQERSLDVNRIDGRKTLLLQIVRVKTNLASLVVCHLQDYQQKSCPSHVYEEPQAHYHHYHRINCVHLYHCLASLWWVYVAELCEEIRKRKLTLTKDMRERGVESNPRDSSLSRTDGRYLPVSSTLFSLFKIFFYASRFIFVLSASLFL